VPQIVVLGGGFAGATAARELERRFRRDPSVQITVVSRHNYMVFTPLLAEVAGNSIEPRHAVPPLRAFLGKARFHQGEVRRVDLDARVVTVEHADGQHDQIGYDYLVIALGAVTNYHKVPGAADYSYDLKSLDDAIRLRNHVLATLELADVTEDRAARRALLTFLAVGGGYAGVEGLGQLVDFVHKALVFYPRIRPAELRFILATRGTRLLEGIDDRLGGYVIRKLEERGVRIRLGVTVSEVTTSSATLAPGGSLPTATVLWAAGIAVNPLLASLNLPKDARGALIVEPTLQIAGRPEVFALGDCAAVPRGDGGTYPPTAQNATREGACAARNVAALMRGGRLEPFRFTSYGSLATIGNYQAVAQLGRVPFSGFPAWLAWRAVYLFKLPTLSRKTRVALDWVLEALFPTDIVQLPVRASDDAVPSDVPARELRVETPPEAPSHTEAPPRQLERGASAPAVGGLEGRSPSK
jgi:NADH:ubiquinone reductase (H+-translocating)